MKKYVIAYLAGVRNKYILAWLVGARNKYVLAWLVGVPVSILAVVYFIFNYLRH
jgi:hypothetical protein